MVSADPSDYFAKFDASVQQQAAALIHRLLNIFPELRVTVKYNAPFFQLSSNGWSVFELIYQKKQFKVGFVNDTAQAFYDSKRHERLSGSKDLQALFFNPDNRTDMQLLHELIGEAIAIQKRRQTEN